MESLADPIPVSADEDARCCSDWVIAPLNEEKFYHKQKKRWLEIVCVCVCVKGWGCCCWVHSRMNQQEISEVPVTFAWINSFCEWKIR
jgi:hypothetical protein